MKWTLHRSSRSGGLSFLVPRAPMENFGIVIDSLEIGKRLPDGVYLHVEALPKAGAEVRERVERARAIAGLERGAFNVVKVQTDGRRVSLLHYPGFFDHGFPALAAAWAVDLEAGSSTERRYDDATAPVLHRKELMLHEGHPARAKFVALTQALEERGLLEDAHEIGNRAAWDAKLQRVGLAVEGHELVEVAAPDVQRHKTALSRYSLSTPVQALWRHGFLEGSNSFFDYGCGRGDDISALRTRGLTVGGWDPHFASDQPKVEADVVNLGFVLNVIENLAERRDALLGAYALTRKVLAVAVLIGGRTVFERYRLFRDGVLTQRGTFQKYFNQSEIRDYLETNLKREPIAVAPGIFFIFRDDEEEQRFLIARQRSYRPLGAAPLVPRERPVPGVRAPRARKPSKWEVHRELIDDFYACVLSLGRLPETEEYSRWPELRQLGRPQTVLSHLLRERGSSEFDQARAAREADLLVYLALNLFEQRRSLRALPESTRRDVRAFWGTYAQGQAAAQALLFSAGKPPAIHEACAVAAAAGLGYLDGDHSLQLHSSMTRRLPAVLRVYLGCAARLYGEVEEADLVKIHIRSGKVSLLMYDDFEGKALPLLFERVKINLRRQDIDFFEYGEDNPPQPLYLKSRYVTSEYERYEEQRSFDDALRQVNGIDLSGFGPKAAELDALMLRAGVKVRGFKLVRARARTS